MKRLHFDMDNVLVDFASGIAKLDAKTSSKYEGRLYDVLGIFALMEPIPGAIETVHLLAKKYDVFIFFYNTLEQSFCLADKVACETKYFDDVFHKCLILSHNKDLLKGDYLIDDRLKHGADTFDGERIQFYSKHFPDWAPVVEYLSPK